MCTESEIVKLVITGANGDAAWSGHPETVIENSYDGSYNLAYQQCYLPGTSSNSTAKYSIPTSVVTSAKILNRHDCCCKLLFCRLKC